jgi:hypothetical protein
MAAGALLLTPLWHTLKALVLQSKVLHTDDTTVPVRDESKTNHRYGRLWDYIGDEAHPGIVFDYTTTHTRHGPAAFLKDFQGFLLRRNLRRLEGHNHRGRLMGHARNKFKEAYGSDPERAAKAWVRQLYDVEDQAKAVIAAEQLTGAAATVVRLRLRQEKSVPLLTSLRQWLLDQRDQVLPKSPTAAVINYLFNQWEALTRYTSDGDALHQRRRPAYRQQRQRTDAEADRHGPDQLAVSGQRPGRPDGGGPLQLHGDLQAPGHRHVPLPA